MDEWIKWLENKESLISAIVGIVTLLAASWGVFKLSMLRMQLQGEANNQGLDNDLSSTEEPIAPQRLGIRRFLLDLGLDAGSDIESRVSVRTVNVVLLVMISICFFWSIVLLASDYLALTVFNGASFLVALLALAFQSSGSSGKARGLLMLLICSYFPGILALIGRFNGIEYFFALMIIVPVLIYSSRELSKRYIATAALTASLIFGAFLQSLITPIEMSEQMVSFGYYANVCVMALCTFVMINFYNNYSIDSFKDLELEKAKTDELVKHILPDYVAAMIREDSPIIANSHSEAAVLFSTIDGFNNLYHRVSAVQLVEVLGGIFDEFDELVRQHGIEKVNTLGTNYVVASGISGKSIANHAAIAAFSLDAMEVVNLAGERLNHSFSFRAGISTGNVVSGVIGHEKPSFDIWGETVELANSMRDTALGNSIVVNEAAYWRLRTAFEFAVTGGDDNKSYILLRTIQTP